MKRAAGPPRVWKAASSGPKPGRMISGCRFAPRPWVWARKQSMLCKRPATPLAAAPRRPSLNNLCPNFAAGCPLALVIVVEDECQDAERPRVKIVAGECCAAVGGRLSIGEVSHSDQALFSRCCAVPPCDRHVGIDGRTDILLIGTAASVARVSVSVVGRLFIAGVLHCTVAPDVVEFPV